MWTLFYYSVAVVLGALVLLWTLLPFAQHEVDRTLGFWIWWGMIELVWIAAVVGIYRKKK